MKFKVIENEMPEFETQLNEFISRKDIDLIYVQYSTSGLAPDGEMGWHTANMHNALIAYKELVFDDND
jgi:hypothetical protein